MKSLIWFVVFVLVLIPEAASSRTSDEIAGRVVGTDGDAEIELPLLRSDIDVDIQGDTASVRLIQVFANPTATPMTAEYLFPLNTGAAVHALEMAVGDEIVRAVIQEKAEAEETFRKAEAEGKAAALLTQHRPNMFTQKIANLMPGSRIRVTLHYVQDVPKVDGAYELVVPMVVGPRYESPVPDRSALADATPDAPRRTDAWEIARTPAYPPVAGLDLPEHIAADRVSLSMKLTAAVPVTGFSSRTHALEVTESEGGRIAGFSAGHVIDNSDLIVRYTLGDDDYSAGVLTHVDERGGFLSLMIEPPKVPEKEQISPREMVFVLDTSGSMDGLPLAASKQFMETAIASLRPNDYFRVIRFSSDATGFAEAALPATQANREAGRQFVRSLQASGGTEVDNAIRTAFATRQPQGTLRIVVFLSDGYIGNEARVLQTIRNQIGQSRIYAFGVGTSVNRYLLDAMAEEGRGYARYVDPTDNAGDVADSLARDLKTPLLTDISIDWNGLEVTGVGPSRIPDLFEGGSVRVYARFSSSGPAEFRVNGLVGGHRASLPVKVDLPAADASTAPNSSAIPLTWARRRIADLNRAFAVRSGDAHELQREITDLGLEFSLQTRFTSFVAVSEQVVNPGGIETRSAAVPLPMVKGVGPGAYGQAPTGSSSLPEPASIIGMLLVAAFAAWRIRRSWGVAGAFGIGPAGTGSRPGW